MDGINEGSDKLGDVDFKDNPYVQPCEDCGQIDWKREKDHKFRCNYCGNVKYTIDLSKSITPNEFAKEMKNIHDKGYGDAESIHKKMDILICSLLINLGYEDGVKIFQDEVKWYS